MRTTLFDRVEATLSDHHGLLVRRDHPQLDSVIARLARRGELVRILPGIYCQKGWEQDPTTRIRAAMSWCPTGVLTGAAAARVSFWPNVTMREVTVALRAPRPQQTASAARIRLQRRTIPADLVVEEGDFRFTSAALTALDLCAELGGNGIDTALRTGVATLEDMAKALKLTHDRPGNALRRRFLHESRDTPWSWLERQTHHLLHEAGITGWSTNYAVTTPTGQYFLDVAFPEAMLAVELDGWAYHCSQEMFESDRSRQNWLVSQGWRVLRFTRTMVELQPEKVVQIIRDTLALLPQSGPARRVGR